MKVFDDIEIMVQLSKLTHSYMMYVSFDKECVPPEDFFAELRKAMPYYDSDNDDMLQGAMDGKFYMMFDTEDDMEKHFDLTVGDDGPTHLNPYDGPMRVYALTCFNGQLWNENT